MWQKRIHQLLKFFYPLAQRFMPYQVYAYLVVGAANTLLNIGMFMLLYFLLFNSMYVVEWATAISFTITLFSGFWLSKNIAFTDAARGKKEDRQQFRRYALVSLQGQFTDYLITKGLIIYFLVPGTVAYIIATLVMLILNYFLQKYYSFRSRKWRAT